jgi:hypothetical protein
LAVSQKADLLDEFARRHVFERRRPQALEIQRHSIELNQIPFQFIIHLDEFERAVQVAVLVLVLLSVI